MKDFMPEITDVKQRLQLLKDNCDSSEETTYFKELTQEDLDVKREVLSENLVKLSEWEDELNETKKLHKAKADPLKEQNKGLISEIKTRKQQVTGILYHIADHENSVMETYDEQGEFVSSRRLRPEEKSKIPFPIRKAANE
jgi:uncharacterized coiled-coil DUF342 family protein